MAHKEIAKDFFLKVAIPVFFAVFLFYLVKPNFTKEGITDYFNVWVVCGIPFGIWRVRMWLIPRRFDFGTTLAIWAANFIIGGLIGGIIIVWRLVMAVWYLILTVYRIVTYTKSKSM